MHIICNRELDQFLNQKHDLSSDKIHIETTLGWVKQHSGGLLKLVGGYLTKGDAKNASANMPKQKPERALICTAPLDSLDLSK